MPEQKPQNIKPKETADPLPSWNDSNVKRSILDFVMRVTTEGGAEFVPPESASPSSTTTVPLVRAALLHPARPAGRVSSLSSHAAGGDLLIALVYVLYLSGSRLTECHRCDRFACSRVAK